MEYDMIFIKQSECNCYGPFKIQNNARSIQTQNLPHILHKYLNFTKPIKI